MDRRLFCNGRSASMVAGMVPAPCQRSASRLPHNTVHAYARAKSLALPIRTSLFRSTKSKHWLLPNTTSNEAFFIKCHLFDTLRLDLFSRC